MSKSRSAHASIRGYLYQTILAAQRWARLGEDDEIVVEGSEDFDLLLRGTGEDGQPVTEDILNQVKHRSGPVGVNDLSRTLAAFATTFAERGKRKPRFFYVSTETLRPQRSGQILRAWYERENLTTVAREVARLAAENEWEIPWPNDEPDWEGFVEAVEFELEAPDWEAARSCPGSFP